MKYFEQDMLAKTRTRDTFMRSSRSLLPLRTLNTVSDIARHHLIFRQYRAENYLVLTVNAI